MVEMEIICFTLAQVRIVWSCLRMDRATDGPFPLSTVIVVTWTWFRSVLGSRVMSVVGTAYRCQYWGSHAMTVVGTTWGWQFWGSCRDNMRYQFWGSHAVSVLGTMSYAGVKLKYTYIYICKIWHAVSETTFFCLPCLRLNCKKILSDLRIRVLVKKKMIQFYLVCAYRRSLWVTTIVVYELSKLMYFKVHSFLSTFTWTLYKSV
jgi:hypothetical protein